MNKFESDLCSDPNAQCKRNERKPPTEKKQGYTYQNHKHTASALRASAVPWASELSPGPRSTASDHETYGIPAEQGWVRSTLLWHA